MRSENEVEERCSAEEQHLETEMKEIRSKVMYARAFLLSVKESAVCKKLPTGLESSNLLELLSTALDSDGDSRALDGRLDNNLEKKESNSRTYYCSDFRRQECLSQGLLKAPGCASCSSGPMTQKDGAFQLSKSKNPYRPPHSYKVGEVKFEAISIIRKTNSIARTDYDNQEDTCAEKNNFAQHPEAKDSNDPVPAETKKTANHSSFDDKSDKFSGSVKSSGNVSNFFEASVAQRVDLLDCDADKVNASVFLGASSKEHCRMMPNQHVGVTLKDKSGVGSFSDFEKATSLPLAAPCEFETRDSWNPLLSTDGCTGNVELNQARKELNLNKTSLPVRRGSVYVVPRSNTPETCGFPLIYGGGDFLSSVIGESEMSESDLDDLPSSDISLNLDMDKIEENQSTFDNFWAEISAILRSEQELELSSLASNKNAVDSEVRICFPDEDSLISIDYQTNIAADPTPVAAYKDAVDSEVNICWPDEDSLISIDYLLNTESSNSNTANNYIDVADSEAEISLPEEDSLITVEDLIAPWCVKSRGRSNLEVNVSKKPAGLDVAHNDERSSVSSAKVPCSTDIAGSKTQQKLHSYQSFPQNPYTDFTSQRDLPARFMDPKFIPDLYCNSSTCVNHIHSWRISPAKPTNFNCLFQYSMTQQPTNFSQQESGFRSSGLNCVGMPTPGPPLAPMLLHPPAAGDFSGQMPFYMCMDVEQGPNIPMF